MKVLLLCSNRNERAILSQAFQHTGTDVFPARELEIALSTWHKEPADGIVVVDFGSDYLKVIRHLRTVAAVPIILLSEPLKEDEHIALLDAGADLILYRPYSMYLLTKQVPAYLRRTTGVPLTMLVGHLSRKWPLSISSKITIIDGYLNEQQEQEFLYDSSA